MGEETESLGNGGGCDCHKQDGGIEVFFGTPRHGGKFEQRERTLPQRIKKDGLAQPNQQNHQSKDKTAKQRGEQDSLCVRSLLQGNQHRRSGKGVVADITYGGKADAVGEFPYGKGRNGVKQQSLCANGANSDNHQRHQNQVDGYDAFEVENQDDKAEESQQQIAKDGGEQKGLVQQGSATGKHGEKSTEQIKKNQTVDPRGKSPANGGEVFFTGGKSALRGTTENQITGDNQQKRGKYHPSVVGERWEIKVFHDFPPGGKSGTDYQPDIYKGKITSLFQSQSPRINI